MLIKRSLLLLVGTLALSAETAASAPGQRWSDGIQGYQRTQFKEDGLTKHRMERTPLSKETFDARTRARFARLDRNSDGVIDVTELETTLTGRMAAKRLGATHSVRPFEGLLAMFDTNRDGRIAKDEFLGVIQARFVQMDLNNDGRIADDDLPPFLRGRNVLSTERGINDRQPRWLRMLREANSDRDNVVTLAEVTAAAEARFTKLDHSKDGFIDGADAEMMRRQAIDYRVRRFVHRFGADKDGRITRDQFMLKASERFARLDRNSDGVVSADEMRPWKASEGFGRREEHAVDGNAHQRREGLAPGMPSGVESNRDKQK